VDSSGSSTTPRTDEMQGGTRELSPVKRELAAWDFARQLERELNGNGRLSCQEKVAS
jgi:hypothetical protein